MIAKKVNVLFLTNSLVVGGAEKHVISLLNGLDKDKFGLSLGYLKDIVTLLPQIKTDRLDGLFYIGVNRKIDYRAAKLIARYIDEHDVDIILSTNEYPLIYSVLARYISTKHPVMIEVFHTTKLFGVKSKLKMFLSRPLFRMQDKLIYVCEAQRSYWKNKGLRAQTDMVIYNGINTEHFKDVWSDEQKAAVRSEFGIAETDYLIGICAALRPEKAHVDLLKALTELIKTGVPAKCLIIGDGDERENIERQISEFNLENAAFITGYKEDVRPLIAACDVMAIVSIAVETFSISALEAMSLARPMIMSDIGGARELVIPGSNGHLYQAGNINELTMALADLVDPGKRSLYGEHSREIVVKHYSESRMIERFDAVLLQQARTLN